MRKHALWSTAAAIAAAVALAACGSSGGSSGGGGSNGGGGSGGGGSSGSGPVKVGAALIGPKNDKSFDQAAYEGIQAVVSQMPGKVKLTSTLENLATDQQRTDAVNTLGPIDQAVVTISSSFGPVLDASASKFPNTHFIDVAGYTKQYHPNVTGFANDYGAPLYVAGVIAGKLTKTGVVGFVGGAEIPPTTQGLAGFKAGATSVNPKVKVLSNIIGDFNDVAKAKAATAAMIADKADVIFPFVNGGLPGAYAAGTASGKNPAMFSEVVPQCTAYKNMVGTNLVNNKAITERLLTNFLDGKLKGGSVFLDLQDPSLQTLALCPKYQHDATVAKAVKDTIAGVNSGKIQLPAAAKNPRPSYEYREGFGGPVHNAGKH